MRTAIMVIPNKPYEKAWVLRSYDDAERAKEEAWKMAQKREKEDPNNPERYKVKGFLY